MMVIGVTGGVGMGKSTCAKLLERRGIAVCDTDELARRVVEPGQPAFEEIRQEFGSEVIGADGCLRRDELAKVVFSDAGKRKRLEEITHSRIRDLWQAGVEAARIEKKTRVAVIIPLLYETDAASHFNFVICVACSASSQYHRLRVRGWNDDEIDRRIAAQWLTQTKMDRADYVVWTEAAEDVHDAQLGRILKD